MNQVRQAVPLLKAPTAIPSAASSLIMPEPLMGCGRIGPRTVRSEVAGSPGRAQGSLGFAAPTLLKPARLFFCQSDKDGACLPLPRRRLRHPLQPPRPLCRLERPRCLHPHEPDRWSAEVVVLGSRHGHRLADPFRNLIGLELCPDNKDADKSPARRGCGVYRFFYAGEPPSVCTKLVDHLVEVPHIPVDSILLKAIWGQR